MMGESTKAKAMMYVQQLAYLPLLTVEAVIAAVENIIRPDRWALIVHDRDVNADGTPVLPHLHLMMVFENAHHISSVAKKLMDAPQYLEIWKGNTNNGFSYLIHETNRARKQVQYNASEVTANFDFCKLMEEICAEIEQAKAKTDINALLDMLLVGGITKESVISQLSGSQYARWHRQIDDVNAQRMRNEAEKWRVEMKESGKTVVVIWIFGEAGTGKTRLAKEYAMKSAPYYITGTARDPWQNYGGEHTVIIDELRPSIIPHEELLRLLDPFGYDTEVMGGSRFFDKAIAAELIIITSPYSPEDFFKTSALNNDIDKADQLLRRLSLIIRMTSKEIIAMEARKQATRITLVAIPGGVRPNKYSEENSPFCQAKALDVFFSMFA